MFLLGVGFQSRKGLHSDYSKVRLTLLKLGRKVAIIAITTDSTDTALNTNAQPQ